MDISVKTLRGRNPYYWEITDLEVKHAMMAKEKGLELKIDIIVLDLISAGF